MDTAALSSKLVELASLLADRDAKVLQLNDFVKNRWSTVTSSITTSRHGMFFFVLCGRWQCWHYLLRHGAKRDVCSRVVAAVGAVGTTYWFRQGAEHGACSCCLAVWVLGVACFSKTLASRHAFVRVVWLVVLSALLHSLSRVLASHDLVGESEPSSKCFSSLKVFFIVSVTMVVMESRTSTAQLELTLHAQPAVV